MKKILACLVLGCLLFACGCGSSTVDNTPAPPDMFTAKPTKDITPVATARPTVIYTYAPTDIVTPNATAAPKATATASTTAEASSELARYLTDHPEITAWKQWFGTSWANMTVHANGNILVCEARFKSTFTKETTDAYLQKSEDYLNELYYATKKDIPMMEALRVEFYAVNGTLLASRLFPLVPEKRNPVMAYYVAHETEFHAIEAAVPAGQSMEIRVSGKNIMYVYQFRDEIPDKTAASQSLAASMAQQTPTMNGAFASIKAELPELEALIVCYLAPDGEILYTASFPRE